MANRGAWLLAGSLLLAGCSRQETGKAPALTAAQEEAAQQYVAALEKQIATVEETAAILATVGPDAAGRQSAKVRLVQLSLQSESLSQRALAARPADPAVEAVAKTRVASRLEKAAKKYAAEVHRINQ